MTFKNASIGSHVSAEKAAINLFTSVTTKHRILKLNYVNLST